MSKELNSNSPVPNDDERDRIERAIEKHRHAIESVDWDLINDEVGVLQAES